MRTATWHFSSFQNGRQVANKQKFSGVRRRLLSCQSNGVDEAVIFMCAFQDAGLTFWIIILIFNATGKPEIFELL
jgi:hypothetical protein